MQLSHLMSLLQPRNVPHFPPQTTPLLPQPSILKKKIVAKKKETLETLDVEKKKTQNRKSNNLWKEH